MKTGAVARVTSRSRSPQNSWCLSSNEPFVGVDTIRVRGRVGGFDFEGFDHHSYCRTPEGRVLRSARTHITRGVALQLRVNPPHTNDSEATFELSVPRFLRENNLSPASGDEVMYAVTSIAQLAESLVTWKQEPPALDLMRADVARDMKYRRRPDFNGFIEGQRLLPVSYKAPVQTWGDIDGYTNLRWGQGGRWRFSIYDKAAEMYHQAAKRPRDRGYLNSLAQQAEGTIRTELLLRRPVLKEKGIFTLSDVTEERMSKLHRAYYRRVGLDKEVGGLDKVKAAAVMASEEDYKMVLDVIGMLEMEAMRLPVPRSQPTLAKYRKAAERLGLSAADFVRGRESSLRLDYESGVLVSQRDC